MKEKVFADGFSFKKNENAPSFVVGKLTVKSDEAIAFIKNNNKNGWVNLNINQSNSGKFYVELDTWEPTGTKAQNQPVSTDEAPF